MFKPSENIVWRKKKKLLVLLDKKNGSYFTLNSTGQDLWLSHIVEGEPLHEVISNIQKKYANPPEEKQIIEDCHKLISEWHHNQLIEKQ